MHRLLLVLSALPAAARASAGVNTFAAPKSVNVNSAPAIESYTIGDGGLEDAHAVVGIETQDGGYVFAGKAMECGDSCQGGQVAAKTDAFAVKLNAQGAQVWMWRSDLAGRNDAANGLVELADGSIVVAGWRTTSAVGAQENARVGKAALTKLSGSGAETWTYTGFSDAAGKTSAFELVTMAGSDDLLLSGYKNKQGTSEMSFKSYGNSGGVAWLCKLKIAKLAGNTLPADGALTCEWEKSESYSTNKAAYAFADGSVAALYWSEAKPANLYRYNADGTKAWGGASTEFGAARKLEGTDLAISPDGSKIAISGHGKFLGSDTGYSGKLVIVDATDGTVLTNTEISAGGDKNLIYNECWGVSPGSNGFVVACGTGIEECETKADGAEKVACIAGTGDPNEPKLHILPGQWLSMVAKLDFAGTLQWQRADQYRPSGAAAYGGTGTDYTSSRSSASEWAFTKSNGKTVYVNDETEGFGLMVLAAEQQGSVTPCVAGSTWSSSGNAPCESCTAASTCQHGTASACTKTADVQCNSAPSQGHSGASKILIVGDSMGEFSCGTEDKPGANFIQGICKGSTVVNRAVSGATAVQWAAGSVDSYSMAAAFTAATDAGASPTHVWLSLGGNDFMNPTEASDGGAGNTAAPCQISKADLKTRLENAVNAVKTAAAAADPAITNYKIVMTGYCVPLQPECGGQTDMSVLVSAIQEVADADSDLIKYVDISEACGGNNGKVGEQQYFADSIHLNKRGYCAAFSMADLQSALGCGSESYDCAATTEVGCAGSTASGGFPTSSGSPTPSSSSAGDSDSTSTTAPAPADSDAGAESLHPAMLAIGMVVSVIGLMQF